MDIIKKNYMYIAVGFGSLFLVPQFIHGYRSGSLKDVSTITLIFIVFMSLLWTYYMYEMNYVLYIYITGFVCLNAVALLIMQLWYYYKRFKLHVNTFENKPKSEVKSKEEPQAPVPVAQPTPIILQIPHFQPQPVQEEIKIDIKDIKTEPNLI